MHSDLELRVLAAFADFLLKTTLAFGICVLGSRLLPWPKSRLALWLGFLTGAAGYWLWLAHDVFAALRSVADVSAGIVPPGASAVSVWHLRDSWALPLGITMRSAGIVYATVLLYLFFSYMKNWWRLTGVIKFTTSAPDVLHRRFESLAQGLGVGRSRLLVLSGVSSPATFGWIRPTILLPDACLEQDPSDLDDIMLHELHHVRRGDFVWSRLATVCRALIFFHPAGWYALRRLNLERELACDLAVVAQAPERRASYAECLIHFARLHAAQQEKAWGIDFAAPQHLKLRVQMILAESNRLPVWSLCLRAACGVMLLVGFVGVAPSLAVLLSYTQQQGTQPPNQMVELPSAVKTEAKIRDGRSSRTFPPLKPARSLNDGKPPSAPGQGQEPALDPANSSVPSAAAATTQSGPQLLHRPLTGTAGASSSRQQKVSLLDPDSSAQDGNGADRKQTLEQSATTALGVYRRLGAVDRH